MKEKQRNTVHWSQQLHSDCMKLALTVKLSHSVIPISVSITVCCCFCTLIASECCKTKYTYLYTVTAFYDNVPTN